eukprot:11928911-Alexandrium_andersonii.AAC.1
MADTSTKRPIVAKPKCANSRHNQQGKLWFEPTNEHQRPHRRSFTMSHPTALASNPFGNHMCKQCLSPPIAMWRLGKRHHHACHVPALKLPRM